MTEAEIAADPDRYKGFKARIIAHAQQVQREKDAQVIENTAREVVAKIAGKDSETRRWALFGADCLRDVAATLRSQETQK